MSQNNVKLNEIKDFAFLADKSYKTANGKKVNCQKQKREKSPTLLQILVLKLSPKQNLLMVLALLYLEISI